MIFLLVGLIIGLLDLVSAEVAGSKDQVRGGTVEWGSRLRACALDTSCGPEDA